jgi:hypothetical protein
MYPLEIVHTIGNHLIPDTVITLEKIIKGSDKIIGFDNLIIPENDQKYDKNKDFTDDTLAKLNNNFENGLISEYLEKVKEITKSNPIIQNPAFSNHESHNVQLCQRG